MSGSTTTIPNIDLALLSSRLINVASSLQGVASDVETMTKTPQPATIDAPPWALLLADNTEKILKENRQLRKDNQDLKNDLAKVIAYMDRIPPWALQLLDSNKKTLEGNRRLSESNDSLLRAYAQLGVRLDEICLDLAKLERLARERTETNGNRQDTTLPKPSLSIPIPSFSTASFRGKAPQELHRDAPGNLGNEVRHKQVTLAVRWE